MNQSSNYDAQQLLDVTMNCSLRPKRNDRIELIVTVLRWLNSNEFDDLIQNLENLKT
jgi:hypothetical protein